jgi:cytochrome P450
MLLDNILAQAGNTFDFVDIIARRLPALSLLTGFGFTPDDTEYLLTRLDSLVKIMLPGKSPEIIDEVNRTVAGILPRVERHIFEHSQLWTEDERPVIAANLLGLLIQSYDAGRGILSNALLQYVRQAKSAINYGRFVTETLRYDPPVHNTRRILTRDAVVHDVQIRAGETVLLVLAAANRDPAIFVHPMIFDPLRPNNADHLTFGAGAHECLARHYISSLAADMLQFFAEKYPELQLITEVIEYEPLINVRLPRKIEITF